jgi:hypothetical protein
MHRRDVRDADGDHGDGCGSRDAERARQSHSAALAMQAHAAGPRE